MNSFDYIIANELYNRTRGAPGRPRFSSKQWMDCIEFLFNAGQDRKYILWILQSGHMGWATLGRAKTNAFDDFVDYYTCNAIRIEVDSRKEFEFREPVER